LATRRLFSAHDKQNFHHIIRNCDENKSRKIEQKWTHTSMIDSRLL